MNSKRNLKNISLYLFFGLCLILIGLLIFSLNKKIVQIIPSPSPCASPTSTPSGQITYAKVMRVIDGDTIVIDNGEHIRYIGMNAPELSPLECYATNAAEINKELVLGKTIKLVKDVSETDKYGRPLRFVYVGDTFIDDYLVKVGAAKIETVSPDVEFKDEFLSSQNYAKENKLGMWGKCPD
jgi:micrococcal nuclease